MGSKDIKPSCTHVTSFRAYSPFDSPFMPELYLEFDVNSSEDKTPAIARNVTSTRTHDHHRPDSVGQLIIVHLPGFTIFSIYIITNIIQVNTRVHSLIHPTTIPTKERYMQL